jgi:hypothetical protein
VVRKPEIRVLSIVANQDDPVGWLSQNLQITFPGDHEIMKVSLLGSDRRETAILDNSVVDAFMTEIVDAERKARDERIRELKAKAEGIRCMLAELQSYQRVLEQSVEEIRSGTFPDVRRLPRIRAAIEHAKKTLDEITAQLEELEIESRLSPRVTVLQKAEVPK